jgi:hypothetical protein
MSPRIRHTPDDATLTSIKLADEDRAAINWIKLARKRRGEDRDRLNDILVDGLWYLLERMEGKTREEIRAMMPPPAPAQALKDKVRQMPRHKGA